MMNLNNIPIEKIPEIPRNDLAKVRGIKVKM